MRRTRQHHLLRRLWRGASHSVLPWSWSPTEERVLWQREARLVENPIHSTSSAQSQSRGCSVVTSRQASTSRQNARTYVHPSRRRWKNFRLNPVEVTSIVMSISETRRSRGDPSVCNVVEKTSPKLSRECTARLARVHRIRKEVVQIISMLHFDGRRSDIYVWKLQNTVQVKTVFSVSNCNQHRLWFSLRTCVGVVDSKTSTHVRCFFYVSNGRLSPMNLSRPSSFATANAPEANLGAREEGDNMQASQRTQARHCCWITAKNEESSSGA